MVIAGGLQAGEERQIDVKCQYFGGFEKKRRTGFPYLQRLTVLGHSGSPGAYSTAIHPGDPAASLPVAACAGRVAAHLEEAAVMSAMGSAAVSRRDTSSRTD